jgi:transcriptional regulator with XRE-family HTH domain
MARRAKRAEPPGLSEQLRQAIRGCGQNLHELARKTGVSPSQLSRFLRQERSLQLRAAEKLCLHLRLSLTGPALDKGPKE